MIHSYPSLEEFLREGWEARYIQYWDANDMIALLETWQRGDVSLIRDGGNYENCLKSIKAKVLLLPCKTDLYFCVRTYNIPWRPNTPPYIIHPARRQRGRGVALERCETENYRQRLGSCR